MVVIVVGQFMRFHIRIRRRHVVVAVVAVVMVETASTKCRNALNRLESLVIAIMRDECGQKWKYAC